MNLLFSTLMTNLKKTAESSLETEFGKFRISVFRADDGKEHVALVKDWQAVPLVRAHSKCITGDSFGSVYCDCRLQLHAAMKRIQEEGGILIYLDQEGRGLGLSHKIQAYKLQEEGMDTFEADKHLGKVPDQREYDVAAEILKMMGVEKCRLLTNNPQKVEALRAQNIQTERVEHVVQSLSERGEKYQATKKEKMGHLFS